MLTKLIQLQDSIRFHARPASLVAQEAQKYQSEIIISSEENIADAKRVLSLMRLAGSEQTQIEVVANGSDEAEAIAGIEQVFSTLA